MCGIFGFISNKEDHIPVDVFKEKLDYLFPELQARGGSYNNDNASGLYHPFAGVVKGNIQGKDFINHEQYLNIFKYPVPKIFLGHVRKTVNGSEEDNKNNHPLFSNNHIIIHNGTVGFEEDEKEEELEKEFPDITGECDTRYLLITLAKYKNDFLKHLRGSAAIAAVERNQDNSLLLFRDSKPLYIMKERDTVWFSSTKASLEYIYKIGNTLNEDDLFNIPQIIELPNYKLFKFSMYKKSILNIRKLGNYSLKPLPSRSSYSYPNNDYNRNSVYGYQLNNQSSNLPVRQSDAASNTKENSVNSYSVTSKYSCSSNNFLYLCDKCFSILGIEREKGVSKVYSICNICGNAESGNSYRLDDIDIKKYLYKGSTKDLENDETSLKEMLMNVSLVDHIIINTNDGFIAVTDQKHNKLIMLNRNLTKEGKAFNFKSADLESSTFSEAIDDNRLWLLSEEFFKVLKGTPYVKYIAKSSIVLGYQFIIQTGLFHFREAFMELK